MRDEDIDFSDIPELTEEDFKKMKPHTEFWAERGIDFDPRGPHTIIVHHEDGTTTTHEHVPESIQVRLDDELRAHFPDETAVLRALRMLVALIPAKETAEKEIRETAVSYDTQSPAPAKPFIVDLPPDVYHYFYESDHVNDTLFALIELIPKPHSASSE